MSSEDVLFPLCRIGDKLKFKNKIQDYFFNQIPKNIPTDPSHYLKKLNTNEEYINIKY